MCPAGVGVRKAVGCRTGPGPVMIRGAWALAARENARAAAVSGEQCEGGGKIKMGGNKKTTISIVHRNTLEIKHVSDA